MSINYIEDYFNKELDRNTSNSFIKEIKLEAINNFMKQGFPSREIEEYKYTDLSFLNKKEFIFSPKHSDSLIDSKYESFINTIPSYENYQIITLDGKLKGCNIPKGIKIIKLNDDSDNKDINKIINPVNNQYLSSLNTALSPEILYIESSKNINIQNPFHLYILSSGLHGVSQQPRLIFNLEENSSINIILKYISLNDEIGWTNSVIQLNQKKGSKCNFHRIQEQSNLQIHTDTIHANLDVDSSLLLGNIDIGGNIVRNNTIINLNQSGASCNIYGAFLTSDSQHIDYHIDVNHISSNTSSDQILKSIAKSKGSGVINSKVLVKENIKNIIANQSIDNLLLSKESVINVKPELEIYSDDVRCSHGATIGELDDDLLFYLRSRGIEEEKAKAILVDAFITSILSKIDHKELKEYLTNIFSNKL